MKLLLIFFDVKLEMKKRPECIEITITKKGE